MTTDVLFLKNWAYRIQTQFDILVPIEYFSLIIHKCVSIIHYRIMSELRSWLYCALALISILVFNKQRTIMSNYYETFTHVTNPRKKPCIIVAALQMDNFHWNSFIDVCREVKMNIKSWKIAFRVKMRNFKIHESSIFCFPTSIYCFWFWIFVLSRWY